MSTVIEQLYSTEVTTVNSIVKLVLSMILGGIIGLERKHKGQKAGLRTFALISMGATLAMLLSIFIPQEYMGLKNGDPGRIAAQVVSGVGFLGAGAILQSKGSIRGLTTAAGIWMTAMIGLAVGAGMYLVPVVVTLLIVSILMLLDHLELKLHIAWSTKVVRVKVNMIVEDVDPYVELFKTHKIHLSETYFRYEYVTPTTILNFMIRTNGLIDYAALFKEMSEINPETQSVTLTNEVSQSKI